MVVDAILDLTSGGIQRRMLPSAFPPWQGVYTYFGKRRDDGTWRRLHDSLRVRLRPPCPSFETQLHQLAHHALDARLFAVEEGIFVDAGGTVAEAARRIGVTEQTFYRWRSSRREGVCGSMTARVCVCGLRGRTMCGPTTSCT